MTSAGKCLDTCPALNPCLHGLFIFKMLGSTFPQESKHFKGLEQPLRVRETERRVFMSILKHACKYLNRTELSTWKDVSCFCLLISSIKQVLNLLGCIIFPDGINYCGISGLSEVVQVTTASDHYLHSQSCIPRPMHSNNCMKPAVFHTQSTQIAWSAKLQFISLPQLTHSQVMLSCTNLT